MNQVEIDTKDFEMELADWVQGHAMEVAREVAKRARSTTAFKDKTGRLRKSISARKSRYPDGGAIVRAGESHSHLIEFGHKGAPAKPFLRPALDQTMAEARAIFGAEGV